MVINISSLEQDFPENHNAGSVIKESETLRSGPTDELCEKDTQII